MALIPLGVSDFKEMRSNKFYYVDKTLFISELLGMGAKVVLLPRPRRFGKTLNLSMLDYFFSNERYQPHLFEGLAITKDPESMCHAGAYPCVFLTFRELRYDNWEDCLGGIIDTMARLFLAHKALLLAANPEGHELHMIEALCEGHASAGTLQRGLRLLTDLLARATGQQIVVLVDEYDVPIHAGFFHGYAEKIVAFMKNLLGGVFKDNASLKKGVITGSLRVAWESTQAVAWPIRRRAWRASAMRNVSFPTRKSHANVSNQSANRPIGRT